MTNALITLVLAALPLIQQQESGGRTNVPDGACGEVGIYQIRECVIVDVNDLAKESLTAQEYKALGISTPEIMWITQNTVLLDHGRDAKKAKCIAKIYLYYWAKKGRITTIEQACRIWNGGPRGHLKKKTTKYWKEIYATTYGWTKTHRRNL